jgi:hypothetical protein
MNWTELWNRVARDISLCHGNWLSDQGKERRTLLGKKSHDILRRCLKCIEEGRLNPVGSPLGPGNDPVVMASLITLTNLIIFRVSR